jgi:acyl-CoA reductase-like NAD-dependent aldehyde dehydrogenase
MSTKVLKADFEWNLLLQQAKAIVPEAFHTDSCPLNYFEGKWHDLGHGKHFLSAVNGSLITQFPMIDLATAKRAVQFEFDQSKERAKVDLDERRARVSRCLQAFRKHRDLLAALLVWEIGKPFHLAQIDVERCITGVEWYVQNIESMLRGRRPLGLVSNIASWNYPYSVLMHAVLIQILAGN